MSPTDCRGGAAESYNRYELLLVPGGSRPKDL
jgi:hypothetical protein